MEEEKNYKQDLIDSVLNLKTKKYIILIFNKDKSTRAEMIDLLCKDTGSDILNIQQIYDEFFITRQNETGLKDKIYSEITLFVEDKNKNILFADCALFPMICDLFFLPDFLDKDSMTAKTKTNLKFLNFFEDNQPLDEEYTSSIFEETAFHNLKMNIDRAFFCQSLVNNFNFFNMTFFSKYNNYLKIEEVLNIIKFGQYNSIFYNESLIFLKKFKNDEFYSKEQLNDPKVKALIDEEINILLRNISSSMRR